ncbi:hypothetical protein [Sodalis glossinidius]|uniref:hypothetical protein n=1 Tax=Sodalis glossinidius TaxID=63612 RepID=UPI0002FC7CBF|nr:hypothetical protein [Sodalis glossinidius]
MLAVNQRIVLRNYLAQQAITEAEKGEVGELARLHQAPSDPYRAATRLGTSSGHLLLQLTAPYYHSRFASRASRCRPSHDVLLAAPAVHFSRRCFSL